jgi:hypothetical protein
MTNNAEDNEGSNLCTGLCVACQSGSCSYASAGTDPDTDCTDSGWNGCSSTCVKSKSSTDFCVGGSAACQTATTNVGTNTVCSGGAEITPTSGTNCGTNNVCTDGACSGTTYYRACTAGAGSCRASGDYTGAGSTTIYPNTGYTFTGACSATGTTLCGNSGYNACQGTGSPYTCQKKSDQYRCDASHNCAYDVGDNVVSITNGYVCTGAGTETLGSTTYYAFSGTSDRCSLPTTTASGFGDRIYDVYACNGANGQGTDVGDLTTDCGTGCCDDNGATTSDMYNFGPGDGTQPDYCLSAVAYDCNSAADCITPGFECIGRTCIGQSPSYYKDISGNNLMMLDAYGSISYKGTFYTSQGALSPPAASIIFKNNGGTVQMYITYPAGDIYLRGTLNQNQGTLTPSAGYIVYANKTTTTAYIDTSGNLYMRGAANKMG